MQPIVDLVAGARPNFMKLAPVVHAICEEGRLTPRVVHTGQHYDSGMNDVFFSELGIPAPSAHLGVGSGSHGEQTARIIERYEAHLVSTRPSATVVFGDVNSTVACALAAVKLQVPVAHVEAGLRSRDRSMPEEINRLLTDAIADCLLVSEPSGVANLSKEGVAEAKIHLVGNVMIDTLRREVEAARRMCVPARFNLQPRGYGLVTMHRPSNVDEPATLTRLLRLLRQLSSRLPLVFPVHPRTRAAAKRSGVEDLLESCPAFQIVDPLSYRENLALMADARLVVTDSGGMQEETTALHVPCLTMRENTERPVTVECGTSRLVGNDPERIERAFADVINEAWPEGEDIPLWDGRASERVATVLGNWLS